MDNFDLRKFLTENKLTSNSRVNEAYDISAEVEVGDVFYDRRADQREYEVVSVDSSHVELQPKTFKGDNLVFTQDSKESMSFGDFWQHFVKVEDEPKGSFGEPGDSDDFGRHL